MVTLRVKRFALRSTSRTLAAGPDLFLSLVLVRTSRLDRSACSLLPMAFVLLISIHLLMLHCARLSCNGPRSEYGGKDTKLLAYDSVEWFATKQLTALRIEVISNVVRCGIKTWPCTSSFANIGRQLYKRRNELKHCRVHFRSVHTHEVAVLLS